MSLISPFPACSFLRLFPFPFVPAILLIVLHWLTALLVCGAVVQETGEEFEEEEEEGTEGPPLLNGEGDQLLILVYHIYSLLF